MVTINKSIYVKETLYDCCAGKSISTSYRQTRDLKMPHSAYNTQITHIKGNHTVLVRLCSPFSSQT